MKRTTTEEGKLLSLGVWFELLLHAFNVAIHPGA